MAQSDEYTIAMASAGGVDCTRAECREDVNAEKPYQVWSGPG